MNDLTDPTAPVTTRLTVNGAERVVAAEPRTNLADGLRDHLGLTGTHLGCEHGVCGACTVLLDGAPVRSCTTLLAACAGREVVTVEGLDGPVADSVRAAFSSEHGLQCGFCTPGMLVTAVDIVNRCPNIGRADAARELGGNLCRCTGYVGIVSAVCKSAAEVAAASRSSEVS